MQSSAEPDLRARCSVGLSLMPLGAGREARAMGLSIARGERFTVVRTEIDAGRFTELSSFPDATPYGSVSSRLVPTRVMPELSPPLIQDVVIFEIR